MVKARASASASPKSKREPPPPAEASEHATQQPLREPAPKRVARIVQAVGSAGDARERERERLLARVLHAEGRSAVTRTASDYLGAGFEFPLDQTVQLKLLEHLDEDVIRSAIGALRELFAREPVAKRPVLEQRLKRVEDSAEETSTRELAADLRRSLRA